MAEQQVRGAAARTARKAVRTREAGTARATKRAAEHPVEETAARPVTTHPAPAPRTAGQGSGTDRRCGWCSRVLPQAGSVGRPRLYCGQACRQRAYEQRSATAKAGLSDDVVLVKRADLDGLQDRLFQLRCALEDVQTLLGERHTKAELERSLADLLHSTGRLDRLWVTERAG
ncbi:hypothetical protein ACI780_14570 [Geodermatophilus sp. SYSU D00814]